MEETLEILGQQPSLQIYTQICLCFPVNDPSLYPTIISTLQNGLQALSKGFPWLAGRLVNEGAGKGNSGIFKIKEWNETPQLVVKDLREDPEAPSMDTLSHTGFPMSMLDESLVAPRNTIPGTSGEIVPETSAVFLVQATFINGGLLLTFLGQHNCMDGFGQGYILSLLSRACHQQLFSNEELQSGNLSRRDIIPLLKEASEAPQELNFEPVQSPATSTATSEPTAAPAAPPQCVWAHFSFSADALNNLKSLATATLPSGASYISTDDALSAFVWQTVTRARSHRLAPEQKCQFARAVNVRKHLNIPSGFPGQVQNMTYNTRTTKELSHEPLGIHASQLRERLDPKTSTLAHDTRALATEINNTENKSTINFIGSFDLSKDIMLSSWAGLDCYDLDFNLGLGKPQAVRRPQFVPFESLAYLMPRKRDGEIGLAICLRDEDLQEIKVDKEFTKYAVYIG